MVQRTKCRARQTLKNAALGAKIDFDTGENEPFQNLVNFVFSARMHSSLRKRILTENGFFTAKVKARAVARALRDSSRAVAGFAREQRPAA